MIMLGAQRYHPPPPRHHTKGRAGGGSSGSGGGVVVFSASSIILICCCSLSLWTTQIIHEVRSFTPSMSSRCIAAGSGRISTSRRYCHYHHGQHHQHDRHLVPSSSSLFVNDDPSITTTSSRSPPPPPRTRLWMAPAPSKQDEVQAEATDALTNVGWALPAEDGDLTSDDPFVQAIDAGIQRDFGVGLDELLNPAKVVNLERDLYQLRCELAALTGGVAVTADELEDDATGVAGQIDITAQCDGGGGGEDADKIRQSITKKETDLAIERRSVFQGWLKTIFLVQAALSFGLSYVMATNPYSLFGGYDWYESYNMDISISVLGYWWWWLFVVPSLRSRRPKGAEKQALDLAFVGTPLISLLAPIVTKDTGLIWGANLAVVVVSYAFAYLTFDDDDDGDGDASKQPEWLKFIYKSLDFGSGRERGSRN